MEARFFVLLLISAAACLTLGAAHRFGLRKRRVSVPRPLTVTCVTLMLVLSTTYNVRPYLRWASTARTAATRQRRLPVLITPSRSNRKSL